MQLSIKFRLRLLSNRSNRNKNFKATGFVKSKEINDIKKVSKKTLTFVGFLLNIAWQTIGNGSFDKSFPVIHNLLLSCQPRCLTLILNFEDKLAALKLLLDVKNRHPEPFILTYQILLASTTVSIVTCDHDMPNHFGIKISVTNMPIVINLKS